jgi:hypothetical protein
MLQVATFIGARESLGFQPGCVYILRVQIKGDKLIITDQAKRSRHCEYSGLNTFLRNWKIPL